MIYRRATLWALVALILLSSRPEAALPSAAPVYAAVPSDEARRVHYVVSEARRWGQDPDLMLRISRQENFTARRDAWSPTGCCIGLMQVNIRPWLGYFDTQCGGSDLLDRRVNACYGVLIYVYHLYRDCGGDRECALRSYYQGPGAGRTPNPAGDQYVAAVMGREGL